MVNSATLEALASTSASLSDISEIESAHIIHKQSVRDKITAMKFAKKQPQQPQNPVKTTSSPSNTQNKENLPHFVAEYEELTQKLPILPRFDREEISDYFRYRPASVGLITGDLDKTTSIAKIRNDGLSINPELNVLKYDDYQKIALAQKSEDITLDILRNYINGDNSLAADMPQLQAILGNLKSLNKNKMNINYSTEEFNQVQEVVLNNFNEFYPDFRKACQISYFTNKDNSKEDVNLTKYQSYCLIAGNGFVPTPNTPDNIHDMESKDTLYNQALYNVHHPLDKQKSAPQKQSHILPEVTIVGDKDLVKKPQLPDQDYNQQITQEVQKRIQNTQ